MNLYADQPEDPYADSPMKPPHERNRDPRDPRGPCQTIFAHLPITQSFRPTGSFYYRAGLFRGRPMTRKEQWFEDFVNDEQAKHDEFSQLEEWTRLKVFEQEAISLYNRLGGDLDEYARQMRTRDQMEMEYQCQRKRQKNEDLDPQRAFERTFAMTVAMERDRRAEENARHQERMRLEVVEEFKAGIQASTHLLADMSIGTGAAKSRQASQHSELAPSKPEKDGNISLPATPAGVGSLREQEQELQQKPKLSPEAIRHQFLEQVRGLPARTMTTSSKNPTVASLPPKSTTPAGKTRVEELDIAVRAAKKDCFEAACQPRTGMEHGRRSSSKPEQPPPSNIITPPSSAKSQQHPVGADPSPSSSPHQTSSEEEESTPPSSAHASPSGSPAPNPHGEIYPDDLRAEVQSGRGDNSVLLRKLELLAYGNVKSPTGFENLKPSSRRNEILTEALLRHIEHQTRKNRAREEELLRSGAE